MEKLKNKLNVVIMGQNCEKFIGMCLESVKDADNIIYCDGGSTDGTLDIVKTFQYGINIKKTIKLKEEINKRNKVESTFADVYDFKIPKVIENPYDQEDPTMNGKQRNFYLDCLKKYHMGEWCLALDADEIVEDLSKIKEFVNTVQPEAEDILCSVKMRHLIGDFGHEDATQPTHFVPHRLFKVTEDLSYPEVEHPVLQGKDRRSANIQPTTIWHLAYCGFMWDIKKRYENHMKKSNMHTPGFLEEWKDAHLLGLYPRTQFNIQEIPKVITDEFKINKEKWYFKTRKLESKHWLDVLDWIDYFKLGDKNA